MNAELVLTQLLRLSTAIDHAVEHSIAVSDNDVYLLVGLIEALDHLLQQGAEWPKRWQKTKSSMLSRAAQNEHAVQLGHALREVAASNDNAIRVRRERVRRTRVTEGQLALPLH